MSTEPNRTSEQRIDALEQRIVGLTHAVVALTTALVLQEVTQRENVLETLETCEAELLRMREETHASRQVRELIEEVRIRLPASPPRQEWD